MLLNTQTETGQSLNATQQGKSASPWTSLGLPTTPVIDAIIREHYAVRRKGFVAAAAKAVKRPHRWVEYRAYALGISKSHGSPRPWGKAEEELLEQNAHKTPRAIKKILAAAGYNRTEAAIESFSNRMNIRKRLQRTASGLYNSMTLAELLGVSDSSIIRFIKKGILKARNLRPDGDHSVYEIHWRDVRKFVIEHHANHIKLARVNQLWFVDLLSGEYEK